MVILTTKEEAAATMILSAKRSRLPQWSRDEKKRTIPLSTYLHSYMKFISVAILTLTDSFNFPFNTETSQCDHRNRKFEARLVMERFIHSKRGRTGEMTLWRRETYTTSCYRGSQSVVTSPIFVQFKESITSMISYPHLSDISGSKEQWLSIARAFHTNVSVAHYLFVKLMKHNVNIK